MIGALAVARLVTHLVATADANDPLTLAAVSALLMLVALAASYPPARRGARVDPIVAVREYS